MTLGGVEGVECETGPVGHGDADVALRADASKASGHARIDHHSSPPPFYDLPVSRRDHSTQKGIQHKAVCPEALASARTTCPCLKPPRALYS